VHLRNIQFLNDSTFYESGHLDGVVDLYTVVKLLLEEQQRRVREGRKDTRMPFRPDHGKKMLDDFSRKSNPGYPMIGRMKGVAEISGLENAIERLID
ncbi:MAG: mannonate dehydratase, partial [Bacteroidales bacterium]|nr:mannonate dehydratase [Bacteroidales bacterium]